MDDRTLYQTILGLGAPWHVARVEVDPSVEEVRVHLERDEMAALVCPECAAACPGYDRSDERRWRHLDTCQYQTVLVARIPRVKCPTHGVRQVRVPWGEDHGRFTALFEALAIRLLAETTVLGLTRIMRLSQDEAAGIMRRAVVRGLARRQNPPVSAVGVDETSYQKRHEYVTVVSDPARRCVLWVGDGRGTDTLARFFGYWGPERTATLDTVVMDMWEPYIRATEDALSDTGGRIVFDRFHVAQHLNAAVDAVRRGEHRDLRKSDDQRLKGTKYLWLKGALSPEDQQRIAQLVKTGLKVGRAWALKVAAAQVWEAPDPEAARAVFRRWYYRATHSRLEPVIKVAKMMKAHLTGILGYLRDRLTNGCAEGLNAKIQLIKYRARGFRNRANFRIAILFYCGALDMDPR